MTNRLTGRLKRRPSARTRILRWYVLLLAGALVAALFVQRAFLLQQVVRDADQALDQEVGELRQLAGGVDPETGEEFAGDVEAIFETFLARNVALEGEGIVTIVDGVPHRGDIVGSRLAELPVVEAWAEVDRPQRRQVDTEEGPVRYLAIPLESDEDVRGVFVVSILMRPRLDRVDAVVRVGAIVYGSIFLLASAIAWIAAGGVLRPLRLLTDTARSIGESDLSRRIDVEGGDEIAELARTFNDMLDRLEEAFATQRRFVDDAGHELRTPITIIRGNLEVMGDDASDRLQTVALVTDELDRMSRIVDDLLVLATAEQPDFVQPHPVDLGELTRELAAKGRALDGRPWEVAEVADAVVVVDDQRVTQAVMNLMRNAVEHTPPDTPVAIGSRIVGNRAQIWVRDKGPGIDAATMTRLFQRFTRGRAGKRTTGGAGLGLAIVKAIAEAHGGEIDVASQPSQGTVFTLTLPAEPPDKEQA
jgi:signal transduction histidine kinase